MLSSIQSLFKTPYNRIHPSFGLYRFFFWKLIRAFKLKNVRFQLWGDRYLYLNYDSFQSMWVMYNYIVDWEEFNLIKSYLKEGNEIVFDIGTNMGFYTVWMSKFIKAEHAIHSFEPDANNYGRLQKNIKANQLERIVKSNQLAVSDEDKVVYFTTTHDGENHISKLNKETTISIPGKKLDTYVAENKISRIAYMKVDVEGFEYAVLKGAHQLLSEKRIEILQLEINNTISNSNNTIDELIELLSNYNYALCYYDVKINQVMPITYNSTRENYFAVYDLTLVNQKLSNFS